MGMNSTMAKIAGRKVLLIAERISAGDRVQQFFSDWAEEILVAPTLQAGIQEAKVAQPSLIIWAVTSLNAVNGATYRLLQQLQANRDRAMTPLILLSFDSLMQAETLETLLTPIAPPLLSKGLPETLPDAVNVTFSEASVPAKTNDENLTYLDATVTQGVTAPLPNTPKLIQVLGEIQQLSHALREPLSNMNMIFHILQHVQSKQARDRYLNVLREEYRRELWLLNQLEVLQDRLMPLLGGSR